MKALLSALLLLSLAACGFTPMYGEGGAGESGLSSTQGLDSVEISLIPDESGVYLRNLLIDHFYQDGYPSSPKYRLDMRPVTENISDLDITVDSESTRRQITVSSTLNLINLQTNEIVLTRTVTALTSYNVLGSQFTTRVSEKDAREAALTDLARQIETQVALYFKR
jgi:LPS-assembly lipoprotein